MFDAKQPHQLQVHFVVETPCSDQLLTLSEGSPMMKNSGSQGSKCEHVGGSKISEGVQKFQRGSKYFRRIWTGGPTTTGVQLLRDRTLYWNEILERKILLW